jgi:3-deoxy-7-phosphoheptulonate synthase/chorismate mutase-like protein
MLKSHRKPDVQTTVVDVEAVRFGDGSYPVIAGPCSIENETQMMEAAGMAAEGGASMLRGGAFKPRTSPYSFQGLGEEGLWLLEHAGHEFGLPTVTEVMEPNQVELVAEHADMLQVGARNMQNFPLLTAVGRSERPVMLKRGPSATIDEWLLAAEYILDAGNQSVVLCERGIRTFETRTRNTLDISAVPVVQRLSHLPVIVDPSHATGARELIVPLALAGRAVGADGLMVEIHPRPEEALSDGPQQLDRDGFLRLMEELGVPSLRDDVDRIDRELLRLIARRLERSVEIGRIKIQQGLPLRSPDREDELIEEARQDAERLGVDADYAADLMELILEHSRRAQRAKLSDLVDVAD